MSKKTFSNGMMLFLALVMLVVSGGCGGSKAVTVNQIPTYPGAVALKPGEDPIADTLAKNMEQNASIQASLGTKGKIEQQAFKLPADASWDKVKAFYDEKLTADGWKSGVGGIGGSIASQALEAANQGSDAMKMAMWSKGKQILTVFRLMADPTATQPYLIYSLNSN